MRNCKLIPLHSGTRTLSTERTRLACRPVTGDEKPTPRELEVEALLCRGYSQQNVAAILGCSASTISVHTVNLYKKRRVHTQVGLLLAYLERKGIFVFREEGPKGMSNERTPLEAAQ